MKEMVLANIKCCIELAKQECNSSMIVLLEDVKKCIQQELKEEEVSLNRVETDNHVYKVPEDVYADVMKVIDTYLAKELERNFSSTNPKPPTVEISLEDAKELLKDIVSAFDSDHGIVGMRLLGLMDRARDISNAESQGDESEMEIWCSKETAAKLKKMFPTEESQVKEPLNGPALPIQDQVNELRMSVENFKKAFVHHEDDINKLKDTISQLQRVIDGMKGKSV